MDGAATTARREALRRARLGAAAGASPQCRRIPAGEGELRVADALMLVPAADGSWYVCGRCRAALAPGDANYKAGCVVRVTPVSEVGLAPLDARQFLDEDFVYREYCCPGCGLLLQGDFARSGDDDLWDIRLFPAGTTTAPGPESAA